MKTLKLAVGLVLFSIAPMLVFAAGYDRAKTLEVMHANVARVGAIKTALGSQDYFAAAQAFFDFAKAVNDMQNMDPPKGSKDDWIKAWAAFQDSALKGVGACGARDSAAAQKSLSELLGGMQAGHSEFKG